MKNCGLRSYVKNINSGYEKLWFAELCYHFSSHLLIFKKRAFFSNIGEDLTDFMKSTNDRHFSFPFFFVLRLFVFIYIRHFCY